MGKASKEKTKAKPVSPKPKNIECEKPYIVYSDTSRMSEEINYKLIDYISSA